MSGSRRKSRFERVSRPDPIVLQDRDRRIMEYLYHFRYLTREQIERLSGFGCAVRANIRLRKLYDHRYLSRRFVPTSRGSLKAVYFLGPEGERLLNQEMGFDERKLRLLRKKTGELNLYFLDHHLLLNDVAISFLLALRKHRYVRLLRWRHQGKITLDVQGNKIRPDAYCQYLYRKKIFAFFLEVDRSTESLKRFSTRAGKYIHYAFSDGHLRDFGFRYFRVLVVSRTETRMRNLMKTVSKLTDKIFWFSSAEKISEETVLESIWFRIGKKKAFSLLEGV